MKLLGKELPISLQECYQPPAYLYMAGDRSLLQTKMVTIVGTRRPSSYGIRITRLLVRKAVEKGYTIVSGLAMGIDTIAHESAIAAGGKTIGVLGNGLRVVYPRQNLELMKTMASKHLLLTEYGPYVKPLPHHFPRRNRLVSALGEPLVVIEGSLKSGTMITARFGLEQGKTIFALPGRIEDPMSQGPNYLISQGAIPLWDLSLMDEYLK